LVKLQIYRQYLHSLLISATDTSTSAIKRKKIPYFYPCILKNSFASPLAIPYFIITNQSFIPQLPYKPSQFINQNKAT
jgi:hypothetical protein